MAGPDLTAVTRAAEGYLDDDVRVDRDSDRTDGGELDPDTGLIAPDTGSTPVLTGRALVVPDSDPTRTSDPDSPVADPGGVRRYKAMLPLDAPAVLAGDVLTVVASQRDPQLAGRRFRVAGPGLTSTYAVLRTVPLELL